MAVGRRRLSAISMSLSRHLNGASQGCQLNARSMSSLYAHCGSSLGPVGASFSHATPTNLRGSNRHFPRLPHDPPTARARLLHSTNSEKVTHQPPRVWSLSHLPSRRIAASGLSTTNPAPGTQNEVPPHSNISPPTESSSSTPEGSGAGGSEESVRQLVSSLGALAPVVPVSARSLQLLDSPKDFYQALLGGMQRAQKRIVLTSLYIGTEAGEEEVFVQELCAAARAKPELEVRVLVDALRGTRLCKGVDGQPTSSAAMLAAQLLQPPPAGPAPNARVALFHTPALHGLLKRLLPPRWNEVVGVQHLKAYIFDDDVIITGANLSNTYFTVRQDRYLRIRSSPATADLLHSLTATVTRHSYQLQPDGSLAGPASGLDPATHSSEAARALASDLTAFLSRDHPVPQAAPGDDTWLLLLVQMGSVGVRQDEEIITRLLAHAGQGAQVWLASAYFNLMEKLEGALAASAASVELLTASPRAHGWQGAAGAAALVPSMYNRFEACLLARLHRPPDGGAEGSGGGARGGVALREYDRAGWQFHAKGLWYTARGEAMPCAMAIGSTNFGYRSYNRDLEAQLLVLTCNAGLQAQVHAEWQSLQRHAKQVTLEDFTAPERQSTGKVRMLASMLRSYF